MTIVDYRNLPTKAGGNLTITIRAKMTETKSSTDVISPFDTVTISDGFYSIVQREKWDKPLSAAEGAQAQGDSTRPVVMKTECGLTDGIWKLTNQFGVKHGYTLVPVSEDEGASLKDNVEGKTTMDKDKAIRVGSSYCFPIWFIKCGQILTTNTEGKDGENIEKKIFLFRISKIGTKNCWKTDKSSLKIKLEAREESDSNELYKELYELVLTGIPMVAAQCADSLSVVANNADLLRKYWFGMQVTKEKLAALLSIQLQTVAKDQGWATYQDRGVWSWFELAIVTKQHDRGTTITEADIKKGKDNKPLTWISHWLPLSQTYQNQSGLYFKKASALLQNISEGDWIAVLGCAQYAAWKCDAASGKLNVILAQNAT